MTKTKQSFRYFSTVGCPTDEVKKGNTTDIVEKPHSPQKDFTTDRDVQDGGVITEQISVTNHSEKEDEFMKNEKDNDDRTKNKVKKRKIDYADVGDMNGGDDDDDDDDGDWRTRGDDEQWPTGVDPFAPLPENKENVEENSTVSNKTKKENEQLIEKEQEGIRDYTAVFCKICDKYFRGLSEKVSHDSSKAHLKQKIENEKLIEENGSANSVVDSSLEKKKPIIVQPVVDTDTDIDEFLKEGLRNAGNINIPESFKSWCQKSIEKVGQLDEIRLKLVHKEIAFELLSHKRNCTLYRYDWNRMPFATGDKMIASIGIPHYGDYDDDGVLKEEHGVENAEMKKPMDIVKKEDEGEGEGEGNGSCKVENVIYEEKTDVKVKDEKEILKKEYVENLETKRVVVVKNEGEGEGFVKIENMKGPQFVGDEQLDEIVETQGDFEKMEDVESLETKRTAVVVKNKGEGEGVVNVENVKGLQVVDEEQLDETVETQVCF